MARDGVLHDMAEKVKPLEMYFKIPFTDALELVKDTKHKWDFKVVVGCRTKSVPGKRNCLC